MALTQTPAAGVPAASGAEKARRMAVLWLVTGGTLLVVLALAGMLLRLTQSLGVLSDQWFYALLTLHSAGMVAVVLMTMAVVLRYLIAGELPIVHWVNVTNYALTMIAAVLVVAATVIGHFGTGWTFLYPLPDHPGPVPGWSPNWAYPYLVAVALLAVAFTLWSLEVLYAGVRRFGNPGRMFGADILTGRSKPGDPDTTNPSIIAAGVMAIGGVMTVIPGAIIIVLMIINNIDRSFTINALVAKELIYFAGHMLVNFDIYLGAGIAYAVLPKYVKRPWKATRVVVFAWWLTAVGIMLPYFHHLYMDFAQPAGLAILGNVASYASALPTVVVTVFTGVLLVYRSGLRWRPAPLFIFAAFAGWIIGGTGALIDSTPSVNEYFHNTLWVPAHFHTYMALGAVMFLLGGVYHVTPELTGQELSDQVGTVGARCILAGGWIVVLTFFASGAMSIPRRYAFVPVPLFEQMATVGLIGAIIVALGILLIAGDLFRVYLPGLTSRSLSSYNSPAIAERSSTGA
ncbi:MAG: cbb3-type cytochrome c oxidase subunit I [Nocardiopsaceae bacterium]|jgi:cytochrome c oxidase subunit 1|nr:cbb3-type cytochrome c oxidase subunit I [Nocardiopsaceae bacterium]